MTARTAAARLAPRAIASPAHPPRACPRKQLQQQRPFFSLPDLSAAAAPQTVRARRVLPYAWPALYAIIADIDSYARFLPYCAHSRVTSWSTPLTADQQQQDSSNNNNTNSSSSTGDYDDAIQAFRTRRWPTSGVLTAGWSGLSETYSSRVFCVPDLGVVEAISGDAGPSVGAADLRRWGLQDPGRSPSARVDEVGGGGGGEGTFRSLVTRWTVRPLPSRGKKGGGADGEGATADNGSNGSSGWSEVDLSIRFQFLNPLYGAVSSAVADKVAPVMVDAFEKEARRVLGKSWAS